ncbi:hypothetical protein NUM3379_42950 [Kineococcus sp. NUM-3379]
MLAGALAVPVVAGGAVGVAPAAQAAPGPEVTRLWLVEAATGKRLTALDRDHQVLELPFLPGGLSIEAEADAETGSVVFQVASAPVRTEDVVPYALAGDAAGAFTPFAPLRTPGAVKVGARPWSQDGGKGVQGPLLERTVHLRQADLVVDDPSDRADAVPGDGTCARPGVLKPTAAGKAAAGRASAGKGAALVLPGAGGVVVPGIGSGCSLRAAIEESNALPGRQTIAVDGRVGTYRLTRGELRITDDVGLHGHAAPMVDAERRSRVLSITGTPQDELLVDVSGVQLANGVVDFTERGGVVFVDAALLQMSRSSVLGGQANYGGGIYLQHGGDLLLTESVVSGNTAGEPGDFDGGGATQRGGGVFNLGGKATIRSSAIVDNLAVRGGGLSNKGGTMTVENSTVSDNEALKSGGGIDNTSNDTAIGVLHVNYSTISHNAAGVLPHVDLEERSGGGIHNAAKAFVANSIVARNTDPWQPGDPKHAPDCRSAVPNAFKSQRGNVVGVLSATCDLRDHSWGDTSFVKHGTPAAPLDPGVSAWLTHWPVPHHPLLASSVAQGWATSSTSSLLPCPATDVAGRPRPVGTPCDAGAYERP